MSVQDVDELLEDITQIKEAVLDETKQIETILMQFKCENDENSYNSTLDNVKTIVDSLSNRIDDFKKRFYDRHNNKLLNSANDAVEEKPFIKVVDIKKILGGSNFDDTPTSPILLTSSDDEQQQTNSNKLENDLNKSVPKKNCSIKLNPLAIKNKSIQKSSSEDTFYSAQADLSDSEQMCTKESNIIENNSQKIIKEKSRKNKKGKTYETVKNHDSESIFIDRELYIPLPRLDLHKESDRSLKERLYNMDNNKRTHSSDSDVTTKKKIRFKLDDSPKEDDGDVEKDKENVSDKSLTNKQEEKLNGNQDLENENDKPNSILNLNSSDSDEEIKRNSEVKKSKKQKVRKKSVIIDSDSDSNCGEKKDEKSSEDEKNSSESEKEMNSDDCDEEDDKKKGRRRIKRTKSSSSEEEGEKSTRKQIRKVIGRSELSKMTIRAEKEEKGRKARLMEKQKKYNQIFTEQTNATVEKLVLDFDEETKEEILKVDQKIVDNLKPHQASGIQFMWDACFESVKRSKDSKGSGCILAHCMGLGKTLQVIALTHTLIMNSEKTGVERALIVCPLNTVLNWKSEYEKWMPNENDIDIYELVSCKSNVDRQYAVQCWFQDGGVFIIGYNMFRTLSNPDNKRIPKKIRKTFQEGFLDPGPHIVICDEGHLLKNEKTNLSVAMNRIKTQRRIVLTGTPLQNNLKEYFCMVQFIKPNLLGTYKEYLNRFVNPITNGQYTDSTPRDIELMRKRSHVLHKMLDGVVQRRDYSVLQPYLPPKHEYVLFVNLAEIQVRLYQHYMDHYARQGDGGKSSYLFADFQAFQRICMHPRVLKDKSIEDRNKMMFRDDSESEGSLKDFIDDESSSTPDSSSCDEEESEGKSPKNYRKSKGPLTRAAVEQRKNNEESDSDLEITGEIEKKEWWQEFCDGPELDNINNSGKLFLLFEILKECEQIGDKVLVFSQSLYTLNCIEYFLRRIDEATQEGKPELVGGHTGSWSIGLDYFRLDGSSSCDNRAIWCDAFNNSDNIRARLFLISTKAGGLGINLVAANRVIIFDVSWNPSHDVQSIYRVYRFGQTKPSYIYRFVAYGTMEMKVYERQVTKQAISKRVIDEQQIDRHYNQSDLAELYKCDLKPSNRPIPLVPKDVLLGELLQKYDKHIYQYHEHQSLLENKEEDCLTEEERKAAWEEFENEKVNRISTNTVGPSYSGANLFNTPLINSALTNIVRRDNPTWSEVQIKGIIPALLQQLKMQLSEGDYSLFTRVQYEIRLMDQAQKYRQQMLQQQYLKRMIEQQQMQNRLADDMFVDPSSFLEQQLTSGPSQMQQQKKTFNSNEIIDLND